LLFSGVFLKLYFRINQLNESKIISFYERQRSP
jgi:hypothetical protein